ncbi:helix-turn-helix domain-containing protein [Candidatus Woesearchaeota archaeon]|nr:helix-turn-helix domain-containing protein [Candidatus Woesearchaeota archaeon]
MTIPHTKQQKIIELAKKGISITEISKKTKVSRHSVAKIIRRPAQEKDTIESSGDGNIDAQIFEMLDNGISQVQIVIQTKLPAAVVRKAFEEYRMTNEGTSFIEKMALRIFNKSCNKCSGRCYPLNSVLGHCAKGHVTTYGSEAELRIISDSDLDFQVDKGPSEGTN